MPRKALIRSADFPYHVTNRSNNKEWFYLPLHEVWDIMVNALAAVSLSEKICIHQFVLMNNHFHLCLSTPLENIDRAMMLFSNQTVREIQRRTKRINHIFGGRYHWSLIRQESYLFQVFKYIYLNPVRAGVVDLAENYPYSTLHLLKNGAYWPFAVEMDTMMDPHHALLDLSLQDLLGWINQGLDEEQTRSIRKGLKKLEFDLSPSFPTTTSTTSSTSTN